MPNGRRKRPCQSHQAQRSFLTQQSGIAPDEVTLMGYVTCGEGIIKVGATQHHIQKIIRLKIQLLALTKTSFLY